jgi:hypothetical protein
MTARMITNAKSLNLVIITELNGDEFDIETAAAVYSYLKLVSEFGTLLCLKVAVAFSFISVNSLIKFWQTFSFHFF